MPSRLTVITGPPGVDIGPATGFLGRGLDDGLAVRVVRSGRHGLIDQPHTSPDPFHRIHGAPGHTFGAVGAVRLSVLPSAWQDPQTNLGVMFDGAPVRNLKDDIEILDALGLNPAHRLTVGSMAGSVAWVEHPAEVGNVGVQARDAVLRAGGRVLVEAGDGQTFLQALATVGIPPWANWIGHLDRWIVLDAAIRAGIPDTADLADYLPGAIQHTVEQLDGSSSTYGQYQSGTGPDGPTLRVALMNAQHLIPGIAGHDYNTATDVGDPIDDAPARQLALLLDAVAERTGVEIHLIGTGRIAGTGVWSWIESGDRTS
jgi:hypothetical protein